MQVIYALMVGLALTAAACGEKAPKLPKLAATDVVVAFGDSLTYGTGADESESYPTVLGQLIGRTVVRAGVPGEVTAQGLARLPAVIDEHNPRLVIVCLGGNDMLRQVRDAEITRNLRSIIKTLQGQEDRRGVDRRAETGAHHERPGVLRGPREGVRHSVRGEDRDERALFE